MLILLIIVVFDFVARARRPKKTACVVEIGCSMPSQWVFFGQMIKIRVDFVAMIGKINKINNIHLGPR